MANLPATLLNASVRNISFIAGLTLNRYWCLIALVKRNTEFSFLLFQIMYMSGSFPALKCFFFDPV